jgi:hypothetical protein
VPIPATTAPVMALVCKNFLRVVFISGYPE